MFWGTWVCAVKCTIDCAPKPMLVVQLSRNKLNWGEENWTEIWFHSVIENNYVETTLATTFRSHSQIVSIKFTQIP